MITDKINKIWEKYAPEDSVSLKFTNLDLSKVKLLGFHTEITKHSVDAIIKGIETGNKYPAVPVYRTGKNTYELVMGVIRQDLGVNEGGHTRSKAHLEAKEPLYVRILNHNKPYPLFRPKDPHLLPKNMMIDIRDIKIYDDRGKEYLRRKEIDPNYVAI